MNDTNVKEGVNMLLDDPYTCRVSVETAVHDPIYQPLRLGRI